MANHPGAGSTAGTRKRGRLANAMLARASGLLQGRSPGGRRLAAFWLLWVILAVAPADAAASPSPTAPAGLMAPISAPPLPQTRPMLAALHDPLTADGTPPAGHAEPPRGALIASLRMRLPAAVFRRGPVLWLVGTGAGQPTIAYRHPSFAALPASTAEAAVLRLDLGNTPADVAAEPDGQQLVIEIRAGAARRPAPWADLTSEGAVTFGATVPPIELLDPLVGDRLHVLLGQVAHHDAPRALRSTGAEILPSWLGAGLRLLDDRVRLTGETGAWRLSSQVATATPAAQVAAPAPNPFDLEGPHGGEVFGLPASSAPQTGAEPSPTEPAGSVPPIPRDRRLALLAAPEIEAVSSDPPMLYDRAATISHADEAKAGTTEPPTGLRQRLEELSSHLMMPMSRPQRIPAPAPDAPGAETAIDAPPAARGIADKVSNGPGVPASGSSGGKGDEHEGATRAQAAATKASRAGGAAVDGEPAAGRSPKRRNVPGLGLAGMGRTSAAERAARRRELSRMAPDEKPAAELRRRLEIARLALADGLAVEAATTLAAGPPFDSGGAGPQESRRLLGAAAELLLGRHEAAAGVLRGPLGQETEEVWLWRAALSAKEGEARRAREEWDRSERVLSAYPLPLRARLAPPIARALIDADDENGALALVDPLLAEEPGGAGTGAINLLRAAALAGDGRIGEARAYFAAAREQGDLATRVRATFEEVVAAHKAGRMDEPAAADALGGEVPLWRGHAEEPLMLARLADFQAAAGRHAEALSTWQSALDRHPGDARLAHGPRAMAEVLRRAVIEAADHRRPALEAMALATSWRNYLPRDAAFQTSLTAVARSAANLGVTGLAGQIELTGSSASSRVATVSRSRPERLAAIAAAEVPSTLSLAATPALPTERTTIEAQASAPAEDDESAADMIQGSSASASGSDPLTEPSGAEDGAPVLLLKGSPAEVISTLARELPALKQRLDLPSKVAKEAAGAL